MGEIDSRRKFNVVLNEMNHRLEKFQVGWRSFKLVLLSWDPSIELRIARVNVGILRQEDASSSLQETYVLLQATYVLLQATYVLLQAFHGK